MKQAKDFFTAKDLNEILPLGRSAIYKMIKRTDFPKLQIGQKFIIPRIEFEKWIQDNLYD